MSSQRGKAEMTSKDKAELLYILADQLQRERRTEPEDTTWTHLRRIRSDIDWKELWSQMRTETLKKLDRLILANDRSDAVLEPDRMSALDWLLFNMILVHQDVDFIGRKYEIENVPVLVELFKLVKRFNIENLSGDNLKEAWGQATSYYNKHGHECAQMLLQRRWHQLKEFTREKFYEFSNVVGDASNMGVARDLNSVKLFMPTPLQIQIVSAFKTIITQPFLDWEQMKIRRLIPLQEELERKIIEVVRTERNEIAVKEPYIYVPYPVLIKPRINSNTPSYSPQNTLTTEKILDCQLSVNEETDPRDLPELINIIDYSPAKTTTTNIPLTGRNTGFGSIDDYHYKYNIEMIRCEEPCLDSDGLDALLALLTEKKEKRKWKLKRKNNSQQAHPQRKRPTIYHNNPHIIVADKKEPAILQNMKCQEHRMNTRSTTNHPPHKDKTFDTEREQAEQETVVVPKNTHKKNAAFFFFKERTNEKKASEIETVNVNVPSLGGEVSVTTTAVVPHLAVRRPETPNTPNLISPPSSKKIFAVKKSNVPNTHKCIQNISQRPTFIKPFEPPKLNREKMMFLNSKKRADKSVHLLKNNILLTSIRFPSNLKLFHEAIKFLRPSFNLPTGVSIILLSDGNLSYQIDPPNEKLNVTDMEIPEIAAVRAYMDTHAPQEEALKKQNVPPTRTDAGMGGEVAEIDIAKTSSQIELSDVRKVLAVQAKAQSEILPEPATQKVSTEVPESPIGEQLTQITSLYELKYACENEGIFYKLDFSNGNLAPINVCIKAKIKHKQPLPVIDLTGDDD